MATSLPVISIITVVFNGERVLEPTIQSVLNQTYTDYEYVVIDGASTDGTNALITKFKSGIHQLLSEPDKGVYDAMNKGLQLAKGEFVLFLNAGDALASPTLLAEVFSESANTDILYGETIILNSERKPLGTRTQLTSRKLPKNLKKIDFLNGQVVSHQSFIVRKSIAPSFNLKYKCSADIEWMLVAMESSQLITNVNQPISEYLQGGISDSQLWTCWSERFQVLIKHFPAYQVLWAHARFALRFFKYGKYNQSPD